MAHTSAEGGSNTWNRQKQRNQVKIAVELTVSRQKDDCVSREFKPTTSLTVH